MSYGISIGEHAPSGKTAALLDESALLALAEVLDNETLIELIVECKNDMQKLISRYEESITNKDWNKAGRALHDLTGVSGNFGLLRLSKEARKLENALRNDLSQILTNDAGDLKRITQASFAELDKRLS